VTELSVEELEQIRAELADVKRRYEAAAHLGSVSIHGSPHDIALLCRSVDNLLDALVAAQARIEEWERLYDHVQNARRDDQQSLAEKLVAAQAENERLHADLEAAKGCMMVHAFSNAFGPKCPVCETFLAKFEASMSGEPTIHRCPPEGSGEMPCCGRTPFEVLDDRMTVDPMLVTCGTDVDAAPSLPPGGE